MTPSLGSLELGIGGWVYVPNGLDDRIWGEGDMGVWVSATYSVVTPLFCAGADPSEPELRLPSFKGVLRYWWRALAWSRYRGELGTIRDEERQLFGGPGTEGRSKVIMRLAVVRAEKSVRPPETLHRAHGFQRALQGANYLGYGLVETPSKKKKKEIGQLSRGALTGATFRVEMRIDPGVSEQKIALLLDALKAVGLLGGMGARSRRGFGSLVLERLTWREGTSNEAEWESPRDVAELREAIAALRVSGAPDSLPEYTALSPQSRVVIVDGGAIEPLKLLDRIGREMLFYRSWGRSGREGGEPKVLGRPSEKRFQFDHDLMRYLRDVHTHPKRIAFGLPHNYYFSSLDRSNPERAVRPLAARDQKPIDRRASPLFIHIHRCGDTPVGVLTFLPAQFLPERTRISVNDTPVPVSAEDELYKPVEEFLNRLLKRSDDPKNRPVESFNGVQEVAWA